MRVGVAVRAVILGMAVALGFGGLAVRPSINNPSDTASTAGSALATSVAHADSDFWTAARLAKVRSRDVVHESPDAQFQVTPGTRLLAAASKKSVSSVVSSARWGSGGTVERATGKVLFELAGEYYVCSGTVIKDTSKKTSTILTAGHCVYDQKTHAFAKHWVFIPDYDAKPAGLTASGSFCSRTLYGCWRSQGFTLSKRFTSRASYDSIAARYDYAFVTVGVGGTKHRQLDAVTGAVPVSYAGAPKGTTITSFGYPATARFPGTRLVFSRSSLARDPYNANRTYSMRSAMTEGASGGGWFVGLSTRTGSGTLVSLNAYKYSESSSLMQGPMLGATAKALAGKANGAKGVHVI